MKSLLSYVTYDRLDELTLPQLLQAHFNLVEKYSLFEDKNCGKARGTKGAIEKVERYIVEIFHKDMEENNHEGNKEN